MHSSLAMEKPMKYAEGIKALKKGYSLDRIARVRITSRSNAFVLRMMGEILDIWLGNTPPERRFEYTPPNEVSHLTGTPEAVEISRRIITKPGVSFEPNVESIPKLADPSLSYLIYDDDIDGGDTLECTVRTIEGQGVARDRIWFYAGQIFDAGIISSIDSYVDRADVFLEYVKERQKDR